VLFLQGARAGAYEEDAKLAANLRHHLGTGYDVRYPQMPDEDAPDYHPWAWTTTLDLAAKGEG
jgi:hypothetical protein